MFRNLLQLAVALAVLTTCQSRLVAIDVTTIAGWDQQLFPSYIITTASIKSNPDEPIDETIFGDRRSMFGVMIAATDDDQPVEVTVSCDEFFEPSTISVSLPEQGSSYSIMPKIKYKYDRLGECKQATPASVTYRIKTGEEIEERTETVTFRSVNDCPLMFRNGDKEIDTTFAFAAYVNEQHPYLDKMLRESLDIGIVERFTGYQSNNPEEVVRQVYSIWDLLVERDTRYSSITTTAADSDSIASQHVRMIEDTINNSQANCVDGSVLMVTLLRKIGIEAILIFEPGHCYMGFFLDPQREKLLCMETTLVDAVIDEPEDISELLDSAVDAENRGEKSWPSFVACIGHATTKMNNLNEKYRDTAERGYHVIDIAEARKMGVLPIAFRGTEAFVSFDHSEEATLEDTDSVEDADTESKDEETIEDAGSEDENSEDEEDSAE